MKLYTRRAADGSRSAGLGAGVRDGEAGEDAGGVQGGTVAGRAAWSGSRARVGGSWRSTGGGAREWRAGLPWPGRLLRAGGLWGRGRRRSGMGWGGGRAAWTPRG